ncbi:MAG TPA: H-NS histone family protein [Paracoccaceae bacterium]|nr:H-NS histone family protein [Paracoccaceae bacterium]HMO70979.1 H-NS histone family protein [Paracoccaceae bacterium]
MDIQIDTLSLKELKELQARVARAIATFEDRRKRAALAELEEKAKELGFPFAELAKLAGGGKAKSAGGVAKYANPANPSDTWTGRGRKPGWFSAALAAGKRPEDMAI